MLAVDTQVVEFLPRILGRYDEEFSELLLKELKGEGHKIHTSEQVTGAEASEKGFVKTVTTNERTYEADLVIESIGLIPNTDFLQGKGLRMEKGAIVTDRYGSIIKQVYSVADGERYLRARVQTAPAHSGGGSPKKTTLYIPKNFKDIDILRSELERLANKTTA